jgi:dTDP-glucose 4,6-dehydratase
MMMKILVFGARGWIGQQFCEIVRGQQIHLVCGESRCDDEVAIRGEISGSGATHVISLIGRTHGKIGETVYSTIDYLEQPGKLVENVRDNLYSPVLLAEICKQMGVHYTYLGTGCIFTYATLHNDVDGFREHDAPNFFGSSYSTVKGYTDRLMHMYDESALNLRLRMPITGKYNPRNFITKITSYDRICSIPNSMTVLPELLPMVVEMMRERRVGTINLTNPGVISHNEILEMYREIVDPEFEWHNFSQEEQRAILASERSNNRLDTTLLETWFPAVHPIQVAVRKCLEDYKTTAMKKPKPVENNGGMNLLITGGCGFIGSNFINYYFPKAHINTLVNFDAMYYCASEDNVDEIIRKNERYVLVKGNLCNSELVAKTLRKHRITHIIHFAAQSHVQNSFEDSIKFTHDNIVGTHTLLECGRKWGQLVKFVHVSTDEVYGESMNHVDEKHKTEHSILCPTNPYAATKAGAELIAQSYHHSYKMPIIITRGNNVYGPNQYPEKLIPLFIKLLKENRKVTIQGNGSSVRAFLHAYDTARAFECILERGEIGEIYNIGCDEGMEYSVMEIAHILIEMIHNTKDYESWIEYIEDRPYNDMRYYISNQKVKDLGWDIQVDLMSGLRKMVL